MTSDTIYKQTRKELFISLYEQAFPAVATFVQRMGGTIEDAKDIFQDALLIYYEKMISCNLSIYTTAGSYLLGISKYLWYKKYNKEKVHVSCETFIHIPEEEPHPELSQRVMKLLEYSGKKCLELLQSFYFERKSMNEIAVLFGFSGERSATAQKYKCLEKVRSELKKQSLKKEDFYE